MYRDLREWLEQVDAMGELRRDSGLRLGPGDRRAGRGGRARAGRLRAAVRQTSRTTPEGHRVLVGMVESLKRAALTTNLPTDITRNEFIAAWKERLNNPTLIPPQYVDESPLYENVFTGNDIDVLKLPVPKWHDEDGGRYIGTAHVVMTQDPGRGVGEHGHLPHHGP